MPQSALSLLTAAALETVFALTPRHQEGLEGAVMLVASATLFYVSYWLLSKMEVAKWNRFVRSRMEQALTRGSALALASVAFLAVYREGFETVLFYKALAVSGGASAAGTWLPILIGILAGSVVLAGVYLAINRFGVRLPLKPFFGVTGALLYYMAVVFAGERHRRASGIGGDRTDAGRVGPPDSRAGDLSHHGVTRGSDRPSGAGASRGHLGGTAAGPALGPGGPPEAVRAIPRGRRAGGSPTTGAGLLRSIERIETDLAEVRDELERMRIRVRPEDPKPSSTPES